MKMNRLALPTLGLLAALASPVLAAPFFENPGSAGSMALLVSDTSAQFVLAQEPTAPWPDDQFGGQDSDSTSAFHETAVLLATNETGLTIDPIHDAMDWYDLSDVASLVIANNGLSSNRFGIPPSAGWSGFSLTDSFLRETASDTGPAEAGPDSPSLTRFSWYREIAEALRQLTSPSTT